METLLFLLPIVYPPALFLLPANLANKISLGVTILKKVTNALDKAQHTKGGLSKEIQENK